MDLNRLASAASSVYTPSPSYAVNSASKAKEQEQEDDLAVGATSSNKSTEAAVYEPTGRIYKPDMETINRMQADLENRMQSLVQKMLKQQSGEWKSSLSLGDIFGKGGLVESGVLQVDDATRAEAQKNIADDGYWGVEQTSDRLIKYAQALSGGDPEKLETMIDAVKKGFEAAEKEWGGKLPDITSRTYDAVMEKFEKLKQQNGLNAAAGANVA